MAQRSNPADSKMVDLSIPAPVFDAARLRLRAVQAAERTQSAVPQTTLAAIARGALETWRPTDRLPNRTGHASGPRSVPRARISDDEIRDWARTHRPELLGDDDAVSAKLRKSYRSARAAESHRPLRFKMPPQRYAAISAEVERARQTVTNVVTNALYDFAKTGKHRSS